MVLNSEKLSLDIKPTYIPKTISDIIGEVCAITNVSDKLDKLDDIIKRLEEEMIKIDAFKSELPLTVVLINDALVALKEEVIKFKRTNAEPVLQEFIPLKKSCVEDDNEVKMDKESTDKKNWLSSVQLWNHSDDQNSQSNPKQHKLVEINKDSVQKNVAMIPNLPALFKSGKEGRAFVPFKAFPIAVTKEGMEEFPVARLSLHIPSSPSDKLRSSVLSSKASIGRALCFSTPNAQSSLGSRFEPLQQQTGRKQRRCWSQDLHRRFVSALQQLGGPQVATPKQIRELMQVNGLTNDEVKSHLQKYRLHTRKVPSSTTSAPANGPALTQEGLNTCQDHYSESAKQNNLQSGSPEGPLQFTEATAGTSAARTDCMEDDEDDKSESS